MFRLIIQEFTGLLSFIKSITNLANDSDHAKCLSLNNQPCTAQGTLTNLHPNEYTH